MENFGNFTKEEDKKAWLLKFQMHMAQQEELSELMSAIEVATLVMEGEQRFPELRALAGQPKSELEKCVPNLPGTSKEVNDVKDVKVKEEVEGAVGFDAGADAMAAIWASMTPRKLPPVDPNDDTKLSAEDLRMAKAWRGKRHTRWIPGTDKAKSFCACGLYLNLCEKVELNVVRVDQQQRKMASTKKPKRK